MFQVEHSIFPFFNSSITSFPPFHSSAAMSKQSQLRSLYRSLLRELPPKPLPSTSLSKTRSPLHQRLRQSFADDAPHQHAVAQADQLLQYLKAQRQYTALLERYNPGMNMDDEERVRLTARRVGMDLPVEYEKNSEKS
ncbi:uncharacterized protein GGS22DRAFT_154272 [Annulohypoxylon maeteangense]|uniref:uncharacterized protein n=1 Tax=Annulohypoxylon maeteangense TaxID=1927788 RepID=UPI002007C269|nr:uncharacterized protein GGS22DRAFT_154272 [Annulohypoxylon maeteangense]KAI0887787.1 hypothetical protein GGS22DRAFT_154272 [Annulohypoxylon maeteangense]